MPQGKQNRTCSICLRFTPQEYDLIATRWRQTTSRHLGEYLRKVIFRKPVIVRHRNQSLDDLMATLILLRGELNVIIQHHNQEVTKLHPLHEWEPVATWLRQHQGDWETINQKITEIKSAINNIDDEWLQ
jgi:hypothetical protein